MYISQTYLLGFLPAPSSCIHCLSATVSLKDFAIENCPIHKTPPARCTRETWSPYTTRHFRLTRPNLLPFKLISWNHRPEAGIVSHGVCARLVFCNAYIAVLWPSSIVYFAACREIANGQAAATHQKLFSRHKKHSQWTNVGIFPLECWSPLG